MQTPRMIVTTDAVTIEGVFDPRYTCDLDNSSPELRWENVPTGTEGFAIVAEDLDGPKGAFTHWLVYNIPAELHHLPAGIPPQESLPNGIRQGINGYGKLGYAGPCPPLGDRPHRYAFRIFALRQLPSLPSRINRTDFFLAIEPFIIEAAEVLGVYQRAIQRAG